MSETRPVNPGFYVPDNSGVIGEISPELEALLREVSELGDIATKSHVASAISFAMDGVSVAALVAAHGGATKAYVDDVVAAIDIPELPEGLATETFVTAAVADKATKAYVEGAIEALGIPDDIASRAYVDDAVAAIDIPELPTGTATEDYVDAKVADKATKAYVDDVVAAIDIPELPEGLATETFVTAAVADKATKAYVDNAVADVVAGQIPDGVATEGYVDDAIGLLSSALGSAATHSEEDFTTPTQVAGAISTALGGLGTAAKLDANTLATKAEVQGLGSGIPAQITSGVASGIAGINFADVFEDNGVATQAFVTTTVGGALDDLGTAAKLDANTLATKADVAAAIEDIPDYVLPSNIATSETVQNALSDFGTAAKLAEEDVVKVADFPTAFSSELVKSDLTTALATPEKVTALATLLGAGGGGGSVEAALDMGEVFGEVELNTRDCGIISLTVIGNTTLSLLPVTATPQAQAVVRYVSAQAGEEIGMLTWAENVLWKSWPATQAPADVLLLSIDGGHFWSAFKLSILMDMKDTAFIPSDSFVRTGQYDSLKSDLDRLQRNTVSLDQYNGEALASIAALGVNKASSSQVSEMGQLIENLQNNTVSKGQYEGQALADISALKARVDALEAAAGS